MQDNASCFIAADFDQPTAKTKSWIDECVLQPFSFLFLLAGEKKYHIIWKTLDSEEATYIWHADRTRESLRITLEEIEVILRDIKQNGRQAFLGKESNNFSRVVHDYADAKKGFVAWKGMLEEKLI